MRRILFLFIIFTSSTLCMAQGWVQASGISNQAVRSLITYNGDTLLAGVDNGGIYISFNNGQNWSQYGLGNQSVLSLIKVGSIVLAGTSGNGIYQTNSLGSTWQRIPINNLNIYSFKDHNDTLYFSSAGTMGPGAIYQSLDTGMTWSLYMTGFPYAFLNLTFNRSNNRLLVASPFGAYYANNSTLNATTGVNGTTRTVTYVNGDTIVYGTDMGAYVSYNNGVSGQSLTNQASGPIFSIDDTLYSMGYVPLTGASLIYNSSINLTWQTMPISSSATSIDRNLFALVKNNQRLVAGTFNGIYYYSNNFTVGNQGLKSNQNNIDIYPNPNQGSFALKTKGLSHDIKATLRNNLGQIISESIKTPSNSLNFDFDIKSGIYFLELESHEGPFKTIKFVKY